ncbi:hypothetical protein SAMN04487897_106177 [Paenibacillus sp. yr247]|uniref:hypothetical protein n=1 Tax=Paenibacillus sp. yr247 TaxID=1761880 RepID=UPI00088C5281|nr:hypothetical protein [Paenibacillus sp. yr247]SDN97363.1 hypothetical protein SAMN04487897_106177 [Paenibacillus sp. yr247]
MGKERLLKWYDFHQSSNPMVPVGSVIATLVLPVPPNSVGTEVQVGKSIKLNKINQDDREELNATIVWNYGLQSPTLGLQIVVATQRMQFSIWRDAPFTGKRLCTVLDSGTLTEFTTITSLPSFSNTITTTFKCTDDNVKKDSSHKYYLTAAARNASGIMVTEASQGQPVPITTFRNPTITEFHFNGYVIDENET